MPRQRFQATQSAGFQESHHSGGENSPALVALVARWILHLPVWKEGRTLSTKNVKWWGALGSHTSVATGQAAPGFCPQVPEALWLLMTGLEHRL